MKGSRQEPEEYFGKSHAYREKLLKLRSTQPGEMEKNIFCNCFSVFTKHPLKMVKSTTQNFFYQATSQVPYKSSATVPMDGDRAVGVERSGETVMRGGGGGGGKNKRQAGQQPPNPFKAFMQAVFTSPTSPTSPTFTSAPNSAQLPTQILSIYGKPLTSLPVKYVLHKPDKLVLQPPAVVQLCTAYLLLFGVGTEGVFRVSGSSKRSSELEAVLSSLSSLEATAATGEDSESIVESWKDKFNVHDVAAVLKRIISRLPEPLCTSTHYEEFRGLNSKSVYW